MEERTYTIPSRSYIDHKNLKCYFKIQKLPETGLFGAPHRMWVLGLSFLENYYTIYDYDSSSIGIIKSKSYGARSPSEVQNFLYLLSLMLLFVSLAWLAFTLCRQYLVSTSPSEFTERIKGLRNLQKWRSRRHKVPGRGSQNDGRVRPGGDDQIDDDSAMGFEDDNDDEGRNPYRTSTGRSSEEMSTVSPRNDKKLGGKRD